MHLIEYNAEPTPAKFHMDSSLVRALMGPIGSGKSAACCWDIMLKAMSQKPYQIAEGKPKVRYSKWAIIRNTYRELTDTTMKTWYDWFPESLGIPRKMDMAITYNFPLQDGTVLDLEILFRALDKPDDIKKLLSLELTGGWINEAREVPKPVLDMLIGRLGRYPSQRLGGPSWYGCIMDTNPPDEDHWWYNLFEEEKPEGYKLFRQPPGDSPKAENIKNLPVGYYKNMIAGKDQQWIDVYVRGKYGFVKDGKPIYPEYNDDIHFATDGFMIPENAKLYVGIDFGLTPAAVFGYKNAFGQWLIFDEITTERMGAVNFAKVLAKKIREEWRNAESIDFIGDPAGEQSAQTDEDTPFNVLNANGIPAVPAHTNDFTLRREAVAKNLTMLAMNGKPALIIGPRCKRLRKAMNGGYKFKRMQVTGQARYQDKPDKNMYSHVAEALQYLMIGAGEDDSIISNGSWASTPNYDELDRGVI